jgi:hypothetical protein
VSRVFIFVDIVSFLEAGTVEPSLTNEFIMQAYQLDKIDTSIPYNATIAKSFFLPLPGVLQTQPHIID